MHGGGGGSQPGDDQSDAGTGAGDGVGPTAHTRGPKKANQRKDSARELVTAARIEFQARIAKFFSMNIDSKIQEVFMGKQKPGCFFAKL